jgi:ABC-type transport system involved in multi-copper enzyme maturation permease subunit
MNATLITAFLRQRFTSPMRLALAVLFTLFPLAGVALSGQLSLLHGISAPLAILFAAGAIGQDVSSGTLQLLLVRPVTRPEYVVSRWLGASLAALALTLGTLALGTLVLMLRGTPAAPLEVLRLALEAITTIAGQAAVIVMLSTLVGGIGDLGIFLGLNILLQMGQAAALFMKSPGLGRACEELVGALGPQLSFAGLPQSVPPSWFAVVSWASSLTLALAAGITRLNRRELSYAAD